MLAADVAHRAPSLPLLPDLGGLFCSQARGMPCLMIPSTLATTCARDEEGPTSRQSLDGTLGRLQRGILHPSSPLGRPGRARPVPLHTRHLCRTPTLPSLPGLPRLLGRTRRRPGQVRSSSSSSGSDMVAFGKPGSPSGAPCFKVSHSQAPSLPLLAAIAPCYPTRAG